MVFSQAMLNTEKNSDLVMPLPQVVRLDFLMASLKACLNPEKGFLLDERLASVQQESSEWKEW